ncbi:intraflagellar transport protein 81 homolog [Tetranychus urticae]|uniref:intraflagellar transport protein 81 homolog n=1 Tax=Tetranychus urticae TaxID=32264 RepID=UPI000D6581CA|nr:intraflagellar transport protein 81 homolog [Tetranychus urticae]
MESIKFIISELNKEPFKKNLNLVTYDNLTGEQRIQILFDIFHVIDETITSDILEISDGEEVVIKIMEMLRILKYTPPSNIEPSLFRQNLISGERNTYTHIFNYLLSKLTELKQRAYLARFLVKIEVSPDVEGDQDIVQLYEQYEQLIENFKMVHSMNQNLKKSLSSIQELQRDIKSMEDEKETIQEKLLAIKRKVDINRDPAFFRLVQTYREEKEKNDNLSRQIRSQTIELESINEKMSKLKVRLKTAQMQRQMGVTPQDILEKLEEEVEAKQRLVKEILPQELASIERYISDIQEIQSQPEVLPNFLEKIKSKIQTLNREINETIEKKMLTNDDADDEKLALVRQSAALVSKKRSNLQETVKEAEYELEELNKKLEEKKQMFDGEEILKGEELKKFVNDVRNKGNDYKQKRRELAEIRTESAILTRTDEILKEKWTRLRQIVKIEKDIANEEEVRNDLRIRMKELQDNENNAKKQSKMWQDLKELMRVKNECFERRKELILHPSQEKKDHLIL